MITVEFCSTRIALPPQVPDAIPPRHGQTPQFISVVCSLTIPLGNKCHQPYKVVVAAHQFAGEDYIKKDDANGWNVKFLSISYDMGLIYMS